MVESWRLQTFREYKERKSSGLGKLGSIKGIQPGHPIRFCAPEQEGGQPLLNVGKRDLWAHKIAIKLPTNSTSTTRVNEYTRKQFQGIATK